MPSVWKIRGIPNERGGEVVTIEYTYRCSLCRATLKDREPGAQHPGGWALTWTDQLRSLEPCQPWRNSPVHLCQTCVKAVGAFRDTARDAGELRPDKVEPGGEAKP